MEEVVPSNLQFSACHLWFSHHVRKKVSRKVTFNVSLEGTIKGKINFMTSFKWLQSFWKIFFLEKRFSWVFSYFSYIFIVFFGGINTNICLQVHFFFFFKKTTFSLIWIFLESAIAKYFLLAAVFKTLWQRQQIS